MEIYGNDPTYTTFKLYDFYLLDPIKMVTNYLYVTQFFFSNTDSYLPFANEINGNFL